MQTDTAKQLVKFIISDPARADVIEHEVWLEVENTARDYRMLQLEFKLGIGRFRNPVARVR